jgi:pyridoxine 5'-phosphate synthase PdxJ
VKPERVGIKLDGPPGSAGQGDRGAGQLGRGAGQLGRGAGLGTGLPAGLAEALERLAQAGVASALRLPPTEQALLLANEAGAVWVDLDTSALGRAANEGLRLKEFLALERCVGTARQLGLRVSVGGGLDLGTLARVAGLAEVEEAHVGFAVLSRSVFTGVTQAVRDLREDLRADSGGDGATDAGD